VIALGAAAKMDPLHQLLYGESGQATPVGAAGALFAPIGAALGGIYRGIQAGPAALRAVVQSRPAGAVSDFLQSAQDVISNNVDLAALLGRSPAAAAAIARVRSMPSSAAAGIDSFLAGRFPAVRQAMDNAARLVISNYGKPIEYMRLEEAAKASGRHVQDRLASYGLRVANEIGDDAARMERLYNDLTARSYTPGSNPVDDALVTEGRQLTFDVGAAMNDVGALSDEALRRWGQRYLPRTYEKHLRAARARGVQNMLAGIIEGDNTLSGYYHRGVTEWVNANQLRRRLASGGWEQIAAPVRRDQNGNQLFRVWRDYTQAERDSWGEIKNAVVGLERYAKAARREVQNGTLLEGVRTGSDSNGVWAHSGDSLFGTSPNRPAEYIDANGQRYVYIGDANRKSGPIKKYGTLSDHYVRDDIAMHVRTANEFGTFKNTARTLKSALGVNWWKKLVTIGNPSYFANNFFVNIPMLELAGGSAADLPAAARMLASNTDPLITELTNRGVIRDEALLRQLSERAAPVLERAAGGPSASFAGFSNILGRVSSAIKRYETAAYNVAGASDDLFRVALIHGLMRRHGITDIEEAINIANTAFYNRKNVTAPIVDIAEPFIPFAGVTHWTLGSLPTLTFSNPHKAAVLATIGAYAPSVIESLYGIPNDTAEARRKMLPEQMRPGIIPPLFFPNAVFSGYDDKGQPKYIDTSTWNPVNSVTAEVPVGTSGSLPRALSVGGPLAIAAQLYSNKNFYTGRPIVEYDKNGRRMSIDNSALSQIPGVGSIAPVEVRSYLAQSLIPGSIRFPFEAARSAVAQAVPAKTSVSLGLTSGESVPVSLGTRASRMIGIKERPLNVQEAFAREAGVEQTSLSMIRKNQALTLRKYERAIQNNNAAEAEAEMQKYIEYDVYMNQIRQQEADRLRQLAPALRMTK